MYEHIELLLYIAKKSGLFGTIKTSTLQIAKQTSISQQTISRKLREMEELSLIKRTASPNGLTISLDDKGRTLLQKNYQDLSKIFGNYKKEITGIVKKGIGEGAYYVSQKNYQEQFKKLIGFKAYPGTLNIKVNKEELMLLTSNIDKIIIQGFITKERSFGSLTCYKIKVNDIDSAIVIPERTRHEKDIIEVIAEINLRNRLSLKDEDKVKIK